MVNNKTNGYDDEEMTVELELDDGQTVNCNDDGEVWFYRYSEDESDPNAEPELGYIDDDEEYDMVADAFDEYLDNAEFDEIVKDEE